MKQKVQNKRKGFTMVELIVVVAIIGILSSLIVPKVQNSLKRAKDTKAIATLATFRTAFNLYYTEQGEKVVEGGSRLKVADLKKLIDADYLDKSSLKVNYGGNTAVETTEITLEAGSIIDTATEVAEEDKSLNILVDEDGINLNFSNIGKKDTSGKEWSEY